MPSLYGHIGRTASQIRRRQCNRICSRTVFVILLVATVLTIWSMVFGTPRYVTKASLTNLRYKYLPSFDICGSTARYVYITAQLEHVWLNVIG